MNKFIIYQKENLRARFFFVDTRTNLFNDIANTPKMVGWSPPVSEPNFL